MLKIFSILLFLISFSPAVFANGFIGNPGDGIQMEDGTLYLRDLVSLDIHKNPFIGVTADPALPALPEIGANFPRILLERKLTDLNAASPGLGDLLARAMQSYLWVFVDDLRLAPIVDPADPVLLPPGAKAVQLANRLGPIIRIDLANWKKLDDANKTALVIHEALYGLVLPVQKNNGFFTQPGRIARDLTGQFFLGAFRGSFLAENLLKDPRKTYGIALPSISNAEAGARLRESRVRLSLWLDAVPLEDEDVSGPLTKTDRSSLRNLLQTACGKAARLAEQWRAGFAVFAHLERTRTEAQFHPYRISATESQAALSVDLQTEKVMEKIYSAPASSAAASVSQCVSSLEEALEPALL